MNAKKFAYTVLLLAAAAMLVFSCGCTGTQNTQENADGSHIMKIAVSIPPEKEFVSAAAGDKADVYVLVATGQSPHTYELTSGQLVELSKADLYMPVGSGIEFERTWLSNIKGVNPELVIVDLSKGVTLLESESDESDGSGHDPHIWLSLKNAEIIMQNICDGLCEADPENAAYYRNNTESYIEKLRAVDSEIAADSRLSAQKYLIADHPAWTYFCRDYGLSQIAVEDEGKEPAPAELMAIIDLAKSNGIRTVFASPAESTKNAEIIASEIGGKVLYADPLAENYLENMQSIAEAFVSA